MLVSIPGHPLIETAAERQRKYPRHKAPKGMFVGWKAPGCRDVSRAETVGMGGLFLHSPTPLAEGSVIELLFELKVGEVRARAIVRHSIPGKGMGVQFVEMQTTDRARLNQFLSQFPPMQTAAVPKAADRTGSAAEASKTISEEGARETSEALRFERELGEKLELARTGTYYQLLGVTSESPGKQIKQSFYALARKYHPDRHMAKSEWIVPLKELMGAVTTAYETLTDDDKRAAYDAQLEKSGVYSLGRAKTVSQKNIEDCFLRVTECLRAKNFSGSVVWLRKCVEMAPEDAKYRALLASSLGTIPRYRSEAIEQYERAIELDPLNARVLDQFAELYEEMQLAWKARPLYLKILEIDPHHAKARERLAHRKM